MSRKRKTQRAVNNTVRASKPSANAPTIYRYTALFERMIVCNDCGQYCEREAAHGEVYWRCKSENWLQPCTSTPVPESILLQLTENVLETPTITPEQIKGTLQEIRLFQDRKLIFMLQDGRNYAYVWQERGMDATKTTKRSDTRKIHMLGATQQPLMDKWFILGIFIGLVGIAGVIAAYPAYTRITKAQREKLAPQILKLTEELTSPDGNNQ